MDEINFLKKTLMRRLETSVKIFLLLIIYSSQKEAFLNKRRRKMVQKMHSVTLGNYPFKR